MSASASSTPSYSLCKVYGKDTVYFATKENHSIPSTIKLPPPEPSQGLITKEGEINWSCPCLGGMATGPCGVQFRDAFSCFHYSEADPKGSDCYEAFRTMQDCFSKFPTVYNKSSGLDGTDDDEVGKIDDVGTSAASGLNKLEESPTSDKLSVELTEANTVTSPGKK